jgi:hypothetical protein
VVDVAQLLARSVATPVPAAAPVPDEGSQAGAGGAAPDTDG